MGGIMSLDDSTIRLAAFDELRKKIAIHGSVLSSSQIAERFLVQGKEIQLANRPRGIFKPKFMTRGVLSVKTTLPRQGRETRYSMERSSDSSFLYAFQGTSAENHDNRRLREAFEDQTPFIYFYGVAEKRYEALFPAFVSDWLPGDLRVKIQVEASISALNTSFAMREEERKYLTRNARNRLNHVAFRERVLDAYDSRCALSGLPIRGLLDAVHLYPDGHDKQSAAVTNGLALSTLHHAAYDSKLLGIDPDGRIAVADRLFEMADQPLIELGLKALKGELMRFPTDPKARPDRDALAFRFEEFRAAS